MQPASDHHGPREPAPGGRRGALSWSESLPFYAAGIVLLAGAGLALALGFGVRPWPWSPPQHAQLWMLAFAPLFLLVSIGLVLWPSVMAWRFREAHDLAGLLKDITTKTAELETVRRELYRCRTAVEDVAQLHEDQREQFVEHRRFLLEHVNLADQLRQGRSDLGDAQAQLGRWCEAAAEYLDQFERLLDYDDELDDEARRTVEKLLEGYLHAVGPLGLQLIRPRPNQRFDPRVHHIAGEEETTAVAAGHVLSCRRWGWQFGTEVKRAAEVVLAKSR